MLAAGAPPAILAPRVGNGESCGPAPVARLTAARSLDAAHFLSGGALGFARGLNDAPKIAALLLFAPALSRESALVGVAVAMALGGWIAARRVAVTMSYDVTAMNAGQGFAANAVASALVLLASRLGLPVSTTHVSVGALFGLGAVSGGARWPKIRSIALAWLATLPVAAGIGALAYGGVGALLG